MSVLHHHSNVIWFHLYSLFVCVCVCVSKKFGIWKLLFATSITFFFRTFLFLCLLDGASDAYQRESDAGQEDMSLGGQAENVVGPLPSLPLCQEEADLFRIPQAPAGLGVWVSMWLSAGICNPDFRRTKTMEISAPVIFVPLHFYCTTSFFHSKTHYCV